MRLERDRTSCLTAFAAAARRFAERHAGPEGGNTSAAAVARVRQHVVAATGCAAPLAREVCAVAGLDGVEGVDPARRDLARLRRTLGEDVEILRWAAHPPTIP